MLYLRTNYGMHQEVGPPCKVIWKQHTHAAVIL